MQEGRRRRRLVDEHDGRSYCAQVRCTPKVATNNSTIRRLREISEA